MFSPAKFALAASATIATVNAHAYMTLPLPTWPVSWATNSFSGTIEGDTYLPVPDGMSYSTDPYDNTLAYWTAFNESSYTSLKDLVLATQVLQTDATFGTATAECGFSLANGTARDLPEYVEWTQLTSSHEGPCEVWCDDTLVFENWNCAYTYTTDPAQLPYDASKCEGASMLTSYWIALHGLPWQVYTNCAPLTGSVSSSAATSTTGSDSTTTASSTTTTTTTAPTTTTATPTTTTATTTTTSTDSSESEDASTANEADDDESSADEADTTTTTTTAPAATTATTTTTTTTTSDKCSVRSRRRN